MTAHQWQVAFGPRNEVFLTFRPLSWLVGVRWTRGKSAWHLTLGVGPFAIGIGGFVHA